MGASILVWGLVAWTPSIAAQGAKTARTKATIPSFWKSQTTHNEYRVQISANSLTAVWTGVPASMQRHGAYVRTECRRVGTKWIGTTRSYLPFSCGPERGGHAPATYWCHILTRIEISNISAGRIEGRGEALKAFDCDRCQVLQKEWKPFTWMPAAGR